MQTTQNISFAIQTTLRGTLFALLIILGIAQTSLAQVTTNSSSGLAATYPSLAAAITALNSVVTFTSPVIITLAGAETAPIGGYAIMNRGSSTNTITIQGQNATITANSAQVAGSFTDAIFKLVGARFVTIRNFTMQENPLNTTTAAATNNMTEWGVALLYADLTNGARFNTVTGNTISLNRSYANSFGIYSNTRHSSTDVITVAEVATFGDGNGSNIVSANNISNVNAGIAFIGSSVGFAQDGNNVIGGNTAALGNTITNWGGQAATTAFVSNDIDSYGIYIDHQVGYTVSFNTLVSATVSGTVVSIRGILQDNDVTVAIASFIGTISNNTVTINSNFTFGTVQHIVTKSGGPNVTLNITNNTITNSTLTDPTSISQVLGISNNGAVGILNISNNTISNCSSASTDSSFSCINNTGAVTTSININNNAIGTATAPPITYTAVNTGSFRAISNTGALNSSTSTISGNNIRGVASSTATANTQIYIVANALSRISTVSSNIFTNINTNTTGSITFIFRNTNMITTDTQTISNNNIVGNFTKSGTGGSVVCISLTGASANGSTTTINNNNFSNISAPNTSNIRGLFITDGTATSAPNYGITNNTFNNWTSTTATCDAITINRIGAISSFNSNVISNISGLAVTGITAGNSFSGGNPLTITNNSISNLTATGNSVSGIITGNLNPTVYVTENTVIGLISGDFQAYGIGVGGGVIDVSKNKVANIQVNGTSGQIFGISLSSGTTATIANNIVGDLRTLSASISANAITAINIGHTTPNSTVGVYFNTVNISATSTGANFSTVAFLTNANATATTLNLDMRNNIFINTSVANGTSGKSMAYYRVGTSFANYATTSNRNNFFAPVIFFDGTNADATLAAYQTRVGTSDANSISTNAVFLSTTAASATFLRLNSANNALLESAGGNVVGITTDIDGDIRQGNAGYVGTGIAPDMGADEFAFVCPTITFTNTTIISPNATVGVLYTLNTGATASSGTFSYSISPALPAGLSINSTTGVISGTPTVATASASYVVTANAFPTCSATQTYTFSVISGCSPVILGLASIPNATVGTPYSQAFTATGGTTGATYAFTTTSPQLSALAGNGLTLSAAGVLSGTPTFSTSITFRVTATTTPNSCTGFKDYTLVINPASITSIDNSLANLVKVSPNPSNSDFNVDFGTINMAKSSVSVYDAQGKTVFTSENNSNLMTISLDKFANGIYLLEVKTENGRITKRLAKQ